MRRIFQLLKMHAAGAPLKPAIILPDRFITYEMIASGIASVQAAVARLELDRERPVGILIDNPARHIIVWLALMKSGFTTTSIRAEHISLLGNVGIDRILSDQRLPIQPGVRVDFVDEKWFTSTGPDVEVPFPHDRIARIAFTSGSTGRSKAIAISAGAVEGRILGHWSAGLGRGQNQRTLTTYGVTSLPFDILRILMAGNTLVFSPLETALETMLSANVDGVFCSAGQARALIEMQEERRLPLRISQFSLGGGVLTPQMADAIQKTFLCNLHNTYASTEASYAAVAYGELLRQRPQRGNCFIPIADVDIVDENGQPQPAGSAGRIRIRSEVMGWAYTGSLVEREDVKGDGWFYPGDVGRIDDDGMLVVSGRIDDVINNGGVKYAPEVFEDILRQHPKIQDAAIVRMAGASGEHEPWLALVAKTHVTLEEVNSWLTGRVLGELRSVEMAKLFLVDEIPVAGAGKVARQQLRNILVAKAGAAGNLH